MAYNTKEIIKDKDGNPISQYYNPETDSYEPVEGQAGANKVVLYNADGTENNELSLIPILDKLSQLTGTVIDEETRKSNELQRIELYNQILNMLETGQLKGEKGDKGDTGIGLNFLWQGTSLGVKLETDTEYVFVDLRGPEGPSGTIENLEKSHVVNALGYTPIKSVNNIEADEVGNVELDIDTSEIENRIGNVEDDLATHKAENATQHGDLTTLKTSQKSSLVEAINELFTNVSNGKQLVGRAITDVDNSIVIPTDPTFQELANAIGQISTGKKWASGTIRIDPIDSGQTKSFSITGLKFEPNFIVFDSIGTTYINGSKRSYSNQSGAEIIYIYNVYDISNTGFKIMVRNDTTSNITTMFNVTWWAFE